MQKILLTLVLILITTLSAYSQYYVDYGISVGASNYLGEIGGGAGTRNDFVTDMKLSYTRWTIGGFYRYRISNKFGVKTSLNYIRLSADDAKTANPAKFEKSLLSHSLTTRS